MSVEKPMYTNSELRDHDGRLRCLKEIADAVLEVEEVALAVRRTLADIDYRKPAGDRKATRLEDELNRLQDTAFQARSKLRRDRLVG